MADEMKQDRIGVVLATVNFVEDSPAMVVALDGAEVLDRAFVPDGRFYEYTIRHPELDSVPEGSPVPFYIVRMATIDGEPRRVCFERSARQREATVAPILVWPFHEAPKELQDVSRNGGDEDWLAEIPPRFAGDVPDWMYSPHFGPCSTDSYPHPTKEGWTIAIGCHA